MIYNDFAAGFRAKKNEIKRLNKRIAELEKELATSKPPPNLVWFERSDVLGLDQQQTGVIDLSKFALEQQVKGRLDGVAYALNMYCTNMSPKEFPAIGDYYANRLKTKALKESK